MPLFFFRPVGAGRHGDVPVHNRADLYTITAKTVQRHADQ